MLTMAAPDSSPTPPPPVDACDVVVTDPPPPYPSRERRSRTIRSSRGRSGRILTSHANHDVRISSYVDENTAEREPDESTPILSTRPRSHSYTSTMSAAPSLARTVFSIFEFESDDGVSLHDGQEDRQLLSLGNENGSLQSSQNRSFSAAPLKRYFRPLIRKSYYAALFHLVVVNFPYALAAWVYLFIFTVVRYYPAGSNHTQKLNFFFQKTGTTLLVLLPLGAVLCFFDLLGARIFARGELCLQTQFHSPLLLYPTPYPPRPIFTRYRQPTTVELETGRPPLTRCGMVRERSFYKNTYAMVS